MGRSAVPRCDVRLGEVIHIIPCRFQKPPNPKNSRLSRKHQTHSANLTITECHIRSTLEGSSARPRHGAGTPTEPIPSRPGCARRKERPRKPSINLISVHETQLQQKQLRVPEIVCWQILSLFTSPSGLAGLAQDVGPTCRSSCRTSEHDIRAAVRNNTTLQECLSIRAAFLPSDGQGTTPLRPRPLLITSVTSSPLTSIGRSNMYV